MPRKVVQKYRERYCKKGVVVHRAELLAESDYTIIQRYQSVLRGLFNYYCMAINVGTNKRVPYIKWILQTSLTKTLASKFKCSVSDIYKKYGVTVEGLKALQIVIERQEKEPLIATFGGFPIKRVPDGMGVRDFDPTAAWHKPANRRSEVVTRLLYGKCELCKAEGEPVQAHHIRALADIDRPGRRPKEDWERHMSAMRRKTLVVCEPCHQRIHGGKYDGPKL